MQSLFDDEVGGLAATDDPPAPKVSSAVASSSPVTCLVRDEYKMPGNIETDIYIIPVSGGADSTALAIYLHEQFPHVPFVIVYTDTGAEEPEIYTSLERLEEYLGKKIVRLGEERTLYQLIEEWNGYLPSSQARFCTRELKLVPFRKWLEQFEGKQKHMFVGIRADESTRVAFTIDEVNTEMPFLDMGIGREGVFGKLVETIGIPKFYSRRSRSGCSVCFFQRRQELVGLFQERPDEFAKGAQYEKLSPADLLRHKPAPSLDKESGETWMSLPMPAEGAQLSGRVGSKSDTLFNDRGIFVAAEFFMDGMQGYGELFVWKQRVISYSSSLAGIRKQVQTRYEHLLATAEAHDMTPWEVRNRVKFAIYYVEASAVVFDPDGPGIGSYTWHGGESYNQLEHVTGWVTRILHAHYMRDYAKKVETARPTSWVYEVADGYANSISRVSNEVGRLVASGWAEPHEPVDDVDFDENTVACPMCSL
jgi:hypothetical protein